MGLTAVAVTAVDNDSPLDLEASSVCDVMYRSALARGSGWEEQSRAEQRRPSGANFHNADRYERYYCYYYFLVNALGHE